MTRWIVHLQEGGFDDVPADQIELDEHNNLSFFNDREGESEFVALYAAGTWKKVSRYEPR